MQISLESSAPAADTKAALAGRLGAVAHDRGTSFVVWAPYAGQCQVRIIEPFEATVEMERDAEGYFTAFVGGCGAGALYSYHLDGGPARPDPASRYQPFGVHGPSAVCEPPSGSALQPPLSLRDYVIYELHVGTFTAEGTFDSAIAELDRLRDLGITALEMMPVAEFPGARNWGYDGVQPFAASSAYGGPGGLRRLVDACHARGMAAILDVVYNHLGPEGNYLREFGPYFHHRYQTGWGDAINFDGPDSDHVRRYFIENALYWLGEMGFDALRLDAVHAIYDRSAYPFLQQLGDAVHASGEGRYLIAESDLNDARMVTSPDRCGLGMDAQWADDLHHALHTVLTGERTGYYADYGTVEGIATALRQGWIFAGEYSTVRRSRFGNSPAALRPEQLVICTQNHDQTGNRMRGERLIHLVGPDAARLAAACVILSPYTPMLFMGEEYGEPAPFLYFVSHTDPELQEAVRKGRRAEFAAFAAIAEPPDPQAAETFEATKLHTDLISREGHAEMYAWYRQLLTIRKSHPAMQGRSREDYSVQRQGDVVLLRRRAQGRELAVIMNFAAEPRQCELVPGEWSLLLHSASGASVKADATHSGVSLRLGGWHCAVYER